MIDDSTFIFIFQAHAPIVYEYTNELAKPRFSR